MLTNNLRLGGNDPTFRASFLGANRTSGFNIHGNSLFVFHMTQFSLRKANIQSYSYRWDAIS